MPRSSTVTGLCLSVVGCLVLMSCASTTAPASSTAAQSGSTPPASSTASRLVETPGASAIGHATPCDGPRLPCTAGQHGSVRLEPALTYTVPDGWFAVGDDPTEYVLKFASATSDDGLFIFREPVAHSQRADCPEAAVDPSVGRSPKDLTSWIAALPGLTATTPTAVKVGGLSGFELTVAVAPRWTHACPYSDGDPFVPLITSDLPRSDLDWGVGGTARMRIYVLDAGAGRRLWIDVETIAGKNFDELDRRAAPVVDSFKFGA